MSDWLPLSAQRAFRAGMVAYFCIAVVAKPNLAADLSAISVIESDRHQPISNVSSQIGQSLAIICGPEIGPLITREICAISDFC
ncbi:hypothetical protein [Methyloterricola oryzae]|uniref:hypothetical protein n=1 Tax=Methyloterricola oryzae TaxID=1495050 RepID=UPI0011AF329B|nr:hypothetical protein [Methyloterricola oryzae]